MANFKKSPHRSIKVEKDDTQEKLIAARNYYRNEFDEEINIVPGFGLLVNTPVTTDEQTEQYIENLRRL
ncbi:TPA: hypothetical protein ACSP3M_004109 [Aeromonas veronii]